MLRDVLTEAAAQAADAMWATAEPDPVVLFGGAWMNYTGPEQVHRLLMIASAGRIGEFEGEIRRARRGAFLRMELGLKMRSGVDERGAPFCSLSRCVRNVPLTRCACGEDAIGELGTGAAAKDVRARAEVLHARFARRLERARARARVRRRRDAPSRFWVAPEGPPEAVVFEEPVVAAPVYVAPKSPKPRVNPASTSTPVPRGARRMFSDLLTKQF